MRWKAKAIGILTLILGAQLLTPAQATDPLCASSTTDQFIYKNTALNITQLLDCSNSTFPGSTPLQYRVYLASATPAATGLRLGTTSSAASVPVALDGTAVAALPAITSPAEVSVYPTSATSDGAPYVLHIDVTDGTTVINAVLNINVAVAPCSTSTATISVKAVTGTARTINLPALLGCSPTNTQLTYSAALDVTSPTTLSYSEGAEDPIAFPLFDAPSPATFTTPTELKLLATADTTTSPYVINVTVTNSALPDYPSFHFIMNLGATATAPAAPKCVTFIGFATQSKATRLSLAFDSATGFGCSASSGAGALTYSFFETDPTSVSHGRVSAMNPKTGSVTFTPTAGYLTPQDFSTLPGDERQRAFFFVQATDEYGQTSTRTRIYVQVVKPIPSKCAIANPKSEVLFNDPSGAKSTKYPKGGKQSQFAITNRMLGYIDCAEHGAVITMSWFSLTDMDFVYHLNAAVNRGVNVRFLINSHATKPGSTSYWAWTSLKKILGTSAPSKTRNASTYIENSVNKKAGSWALFCDHGCLTPAANSNSGKIWKSEESEYPALHAKFFLITNISAKSSKKTSVSGVASSNPTRAQAVQGFNSAQIFVEKSTSLKKNQLFTAFDSYFRKLSAQGKANFAAKTPPKAASYTQLATKGNTQFVTFPRIGGGAATDDMTTLFKNVKCRYIDAHGQWQRTKIYMNMFVFTRNSPAIALWHLANNRPIANGGCEVHIIYTDMDQAISLNGSYIKGPGGYVSWGVADCLSTSGTTNGKYSGVTVPERRKMLDNNGNVIKTAAGKIRYQTASVCKLGTLMGRMPTINQGVGSYCWLNTHSSVSGGSISACVSTPLKLTIQDPADGRAKLEAWPDSANHVRFSHQKYILIDGMVNKEIQQVVYSGTPNLTSPGLRYNDEVMTITKGESFFKAYKGNFDTMLNFIHNRPGALPDFCRSQGTCQ